jgi:hypothetical protein
MPFPPLAHYKTGVFTRGVPGPVLEFRRGLLLVSIDSQNHSQAVGRLLLGHPQLVITLDLIKKRFKLLLDDLNSRFVR